MIYVGGGVFKVITTGFVLPGEVKVYTNIWGNSELVKTFEQNGRGKDNIFAEKLRVG